MDVQMLSSSSRATTGILGLVVVALVYNIYKAIYNIYFHPLSKYPGPKHRAAFHVPFFYHIFKGTYDHDLKSLHERYGPIVRMRPDSLSFTSSGAIKDIYGGGGKKPLPKDAEFYTIGGNGTPSIIWSSDEDHSRMRKLLSHAFSDAALRGQEEILTQYFELLVSQLQKQVDDPTVEHVDMTQWYNFVTFDVIGDLAYGKSFGALESGKYHPWMSNLFQGIKATRVLKVAAYYQPMMKIIQVLIKSIPKLNQARKEHMQLTKNKTLERLETKTDRKDFMTYILRHNDERGMTKEELLGTSEILIVGGSETTSTLLTGVTYFLLKNPEIYAKAKQEVRAVFKSGDEMTLQSTAQLPYLQAVLEEGLRMYPPVPLGLPRRTPPGGCIVNGEFVPGNTAVAVHNLSSLQSSSNFHEPEVFAPERWLSNPPEKYANDDRAAFNPFSAGPRGCIGKNLAWNEMRSVLARMLFYFEMELCDKSQEWNNHRIFMLWDKPPLNIKIQHRKD